MYALKIDCHGPLRCWKTYLCEYFSLYLSRIQIYICLLYLVADWYNHWLSRAAPLIFALLKKMPPAGKVLRWFHRWQRNEHSSSYWPSILIAAMYVKERSVFHEEKKLKPMMWYIFEKEMAQGPQKQCSQVSDTQIHKWKYTNTQIQFGSNYQIDMW